MALGLLVIALYYYFVFYHTQTSVLRMYFYLLTERSSMVLAIQSDFFLSTLLSCINVITLMWEERVTSQKVEYISFNPNLSRSSGNYEQKLALPLRKGLGKMRL